MSIIMTADGWKQLTPMYHGAGCYSYPNARQPLPHKSEAREPYHGTLPTQESKDYIRAIQQYLRGEISLESCSATMSRRTP